jgi:hypothetical protein
MVSHLCGGAEVRKQNGQRRGWMDLDIAVGVDDPNWMLLC